MRHILFALLTLCCFSASFSQLYHSGGTFNVDCDVIVFDDGGPSADYSDGYNQTMTLSFPPYVVDVALNFGVFDMGGTNLDTLIIYHTAVAPGNLVGKYFGNTLPGDVIIPHDVIILQVKTNAGPPPSSFPGFVLNFQGQFDGGSAVPTDIDCAPIDNGEITVTASGGTMPYIYSNDSSSTWQTNNVFTGLSAGSYDDLLIEDFQGCIDPVGAVSISDASVAFNVVPTVTNVTCNGDGDGSIAVTVSGPAGNFDLAWSTGLDEEDVTSGGISSLAPGNYSVTISRESDTTCLQTENFTITEPSILTETHFILDTISCNNACDGSIAITAAGGTPPYQYSDDGGTSHQVSNVLDSLCAGNINYEVEDANGCTVGGIQSLIEPPVLTIGTTGTDPTGSGSGDGSVNSTPGGGTPPYTYVWNTAPVATTQNISGLDGGTYTVTVTDDNGCTAQATEVLFEPAVFDGGVIEFAAGSNFFELVCFGASTSAVQNRTLASGGTAPLAYSWEWSTDLSTWNTMAGTGSSYGVYTPTQDVFIRRVVTDAGLNTAYSNALTINYIEEVIPVISGLDTTYCQNDPFVVMNGSPSSGTSYFTINGYDSVATSLAFSPTDTLLQDTTYNIDTNVVSYTYIDNNGCVFTSNNFEFYIYDTVLFDLEFFQTEYIVGEDNVYLPGKVNPLPTGGVGVFSGPGVSGDSLFLSIAGTGGNKSYSFTYTDTTGCVSTDTDSINIVNAGVITGLGDALFCNDEGLIAISADDPKGSTPQPWTPSTPNYPGPSQTYFSGFKLYDADGVDISGVLTSNGVTACCTTTDNDGIDLSVIPVTPGQFLDTFRLEYRYQNKVQNGIYWDVKCINFPFIGCINVPWAYPTYGKVTYKTSRYFYVEHLNSAGNFANLAPPYCSNAGPTNIVAENQDPLGGISEWTITGAPAFSNDGLTNTTQTTVTFTPNNFNGAQNTTYNINYLYKSPLEQCQAMINSTIEVSSVASLTLSTDNSVSVVVPSELCLGLTDTIYGYADGNPVGNFSGNNMNNGTADDGIAIVNTSTGPVINEPITFTYTDANGCTIDSTWLFTVHDQPVVALAQPYVSICLNDSILFEGLGDGAPNVGAFYTNSGITDTLTPGQAYFVADSTVLAPDSAYAFTYEYTDANNCTNSISSQIYVNDLPTPQINIDGNEFCSNEIANVNANPYAGTDDSIFYNGVYVPWESSGFYTLDASTFPTGQVFAEYYYIDNNGCKAYSIDSAQIYPTPTAYFTFNSNCITDTIMFQDSSTTNGATISNYSWIFSDGFASSSQDTAVLFQTPGQKVITFTLTTSAGCQEQYQLIEWFGDKPRVDFDWTNECLIGGNSNTQFVNNTPVIDSVTMWSWTFGDPGNTASTLYEPLFNYTTQGSYLVTVIGETDYGCIDTAMKSIWIRDYIQSYPYFADFETGNYGWVPDTLVGINNSWEWGQPSGTGDIDSAYSGNNVMMTSLADNHNNLEYSFLVSPCFDFSQLKRPMIKIKIWGETNQGDGLKMEYGDQGQDYFPLGTVGKGINWYDDFVTGLIETDPNGTTSPEGWYGSTGGWVDARYQLDTLVGDSMVRFKIIFGSDVAQSMDGFAIDDIWIGERSRTVLVEHFTSYDDGLSQVLTPFFNGVIDDPYLNDYQMDLVNVQYHTSQSPTEILNLNYQAGPAARSNYYGLDSIPYCINDGTSFQGNVNNWYANIEMLEARTLIDPQFDLQLAVQQTGADFSISADFSANEDLGNREIVVRMAIVEDSIDLSGQGVAGMHRNTLIDFVPGASGRSFTNLWTIGTSDNMTEFTTVTNAFNLNNLDVVVWIQDKDSKEVYQASSGTISTLLGLTGVHDKSAAMDFIIYPNPTNSTSTILLNNAFNENGEIVIQDASGKLIEKLEINKFQERIELFNSNYKNGMYFVSVVSPNGEMLTKKMIVSKN